MPNKKINKKKKKEKERLHLGAVKVNVIYLCQIDVLFCNLSGDKKMRST